MLILIIGLAIFLGIHSVRIVAPAWREGMIARLGERGWKGAYSLISLIGLLLIIFGFGMARQDPVILYSPPVWMRHITLLLMMPAFVILAAAEIPCRMKIALKHPMLVGVKLWAVAHLLANGTLGDVVLFGSFLAWAVCDRIAVKRRPVVAPVSDVAPPLANDIIALVIGATAYVIFVVFLHEWLFGVSPM